MTEVNPDMVEDEAVATVKHEDVVDGRLVDQLVGRAREQGVALTGEKGVLGAVERGGSLPVVLHSWSWSFGNGGWSSAVRLG